jgi:hypothetical protein
MSYLRAGRSSSRPPRMSAVADGSVRRLVAARRKLLMRSRLSEISGSCKAIHHFTGGTGMTPGKTYACSIAMTPITAAPAIECQTTVRKIGPSACVRSCGSS